jgi:hypothetical protein
MGDWWVTSGARGAEVWRLEEERRRKPEEKGEAEAGQPEDDARGRRLGEATWLSG